MYFSQNFLINKAYCCCEAIDVYAFKAIKEPSWGVTKESAVERFVLPT